MIASWDHRVDHRCPQCGEPVTGTARTRDSDGFHYTVQPCDHEVPMEDVLTPLTYPQLVARMVGHLDEALAELRERSWDPATGPCRPEQAAAAWDAVGHLAAARTALNATLPEGGRR